MSTSNQHKQKTGPNNQLVDLKTFMAKYIYHWPLFILGLVIALSCAYVYMQVVNPVYEVNASILVKDEKKSPEEKSALPELDQSSSPKNAEAEIEILRSKKIVKQVVNELQLWATYKTSTRFKTVDLYETTPVRFQLAQKGSLLNNNKIAITILNKSSFQLQQLNGQMRTVAFNEPVKSAFGTWDLKPTDFLDQYIGSTITINVNEPDNVATNYVKALDTHLLDKLAPTIGISITDEVPKRGEDFLNGLIKDYNDAAAVEQKRKTKSTIDFIDSRLASLTGELGKAEQKVEGYRSSQGITDISSQSQAYLENVQNNEQKLNEVNVQLNIIDGIEQYVNSPGTNTNAPATIGITDPALNSQIEKLGELQLKKSALLATTPEKNPLFDPLNKQISLTKESIKETIKGIKSSLLNSKRQLQAFNGKVESSIKDIPVQERQFVDMKRQQSIKENLYVYLLQKREELALSYASTSVDARIVDQANIGDIKWPRKSLVFAVALLCGFGLPFLLIYFRQTFSNSITSRREIENALDAPILGEVSFGDVGDGIVVVNNRNNLIGEQIRSLRTNLHYLHQSNKAAPSPLQSVVTTMAVADSSRVTLFTSSISKEGKSFISSNIAASLAASGKKTVILEMDLRKPKISGIFDLPTNHAGISEYLSGNATLDQILQPVPNSNLLVIGSGKTPTDPSELLESDRLVQLITELRTKFDDVIIDSPPLHLVTDAMIIARIVDASVYVMRQGYTSKDELNFISDIYEQDKLPNLSIVFNGIKKKKYGYGYSYDNSYYNQDSRRPSFNMSWKLFFNRF